MCALSLDERETQELSEHHVLTGTRRLTHARERRQTRSPVALDCLVTLLPCFVLYDYAT